ncbi:MAG TPA: hypothetical protein VGK10_18765 [Prolixibacteraceae bacterium]|jgi:hypothetical protein
MAQQNAVLALRESIRLLEIRQEEEGKILKDQFRFTFESLKPVNLIKSSMKDLVNSMEIKNSLIETIVSLVSGYLSKKLIVNSKSSILMKIVGIALQFGVTNLVSNNADEVRQFFSNLIDRFTRPAEDVEVPEVEV